MVTRTKDNEKLNKILKILVLCIIMSIILCVKTNKAYAQETIRVKVGETIRKELRPSLKYYEVLSLNQNGEGKESIEKSIETDKYTVNFKLEGIYGDEFVMEITGKKEGKSQQEILYYMYKKEGEPFTPFRSEVLVDVYEEKKEEQKPEGGEKEPKDNKNNEKIDIHSSKVNNNINTKLIKVNFQNAEYTSVADVHVREGNFVGAKSLGVVKEGTKLTSTGYTDNGWVRVIYNGKAGFVSSDYLKLKKHANLTRKMQEEKKKEEKEYKEEIKKVGAVDSKGRTKEKQIEYLKSTIGAVPNVGNNMQFKIFLLFTAFGITLAYVYTKNKKNQEKN